MEPVKPEFERVLNVRDFGGFKTDSGQIIKSNKLFRGAQISNMSGKDQRLMRALGVNVVVDFRYQSERRKQSTKTGAGFDPEILVYDGQFDIQDKTGFAPHEHFIIHDFDGAESSRQYMINSYQSRPHLPAFVNLASRTLKHMALSGDTLYVHCAAGKDRTGTFVAIVLKALGVADDDIMDDYMQSAQIPSLDLIIERAAGKLKAQHNRQYTPQGLLPFFSVEPEYLKSSLQAMGAFETYLSQTLGINAKEREQLMALYQG